MVDIAATREYAEVAARYAGRAAARSGVPYMRHIDEGLRVLEWLGASERAGRAFCLHPLLQADADLVASWPRLSELTGDPRVLALALEYRRVANAYLSPRETGDPVEIDLGPLPEVHDMLRADKVQNYKDFLLHHAATHPRRDALDRYFTRWLARLAVSPAQFAAWAAALRDMS
jgi:hypothetical protein